MIKSSEAQGVAERRDEVIVGMYDDVHVTGRDVWRCFFCKHCPNQATKVKEQLKPDEFIKYLLEVMDECPKRSIAEYYKPEESCHDNKAFAEYALYNCHGFTRRRDTKQEYNNKSKWFKFFSGFFKTKINGQWRYTCEKSMDGLRTMWRGFTGDIPTPWDTKILPRAILLDKKKNLWTRSTTKMSNDSLEWQPKHTNMMARSIIEIMERNKLLDVLVAHVEATAAKRHTILNSIGWVLATEGKLKKEDKCLSIDDMANKYLPDDMHNPNAKEIVPEDWDVSDEAALRDINK